MREFYLIDLYHQAPYIPQTAHSWPFSRLLSWLRVYGEVYLIPDLPRHFYFHAWCGNDGVFSYDIDGTLRFIGDHWQKVLWKPNSS